MLAGTPFQWNFLILATLARTSCAVASSTSSAPVSFCLVVSAATIILTAANSCLAAARLSLLPSFFPSSSLNSAGRICHHGYCNTALMKLCRYRLQSEGVSRQRAKHHERKPQHGWLQ